MSFHRRTSLLRTVAVIAATAFLMSLQTSDTIAQLPEKSLVSPPVVLQPGILDFLTNAPVAEAMQQLAKPKLLQKAFEGLPKSDPKGLASIIKAKEVDVANRVAAAKYLGSVDCQVFPESQLALKDLLYDEFEPVRYEAAVALHKQFTRGPASAGTWLTGTPIRKDTCLGCCNTDNAVEVFKAMQDQAYGVTYSSTGCCMKEPSARVRFMLVSAIQLCGYCEPSIATPIPAKPLEPRVEPAVIPESREGRAIVPMPELPSVPGEDAPIPSGTIKPNPAPPAAPAEEPVAPREALLLVPPSPISSFSPYRSEIAPAGFQSAKASVTPDGPRELENLQGFCPVRLAEDGVHVIGCDQFTSEFQGYFDRYQIKFSSSSTLKKFENNPQQYFPVLDGFCVTTWSQHGTLSKGQYIHTYKGRVYCFALQQWVIDFKENPEQVLKLMEERLSTSDKATKLVGF